MLASEFPTAHQPGASRPLPLESIVSGRTAAVMGVVNVTPDSFSDGGQFIDPAAALTHARLLVSEGADLLDIGAESTRPYAGATPVDAAEELRRLGPVLPEATRLGVPVSIDTMKASVAEWALANGAAILNDVWGLQGDPAIASVAAAHGAPVIVMHNRKSVDPGIDIVADMLAFFERSLQIAAKAGIASGQIALDPGIGFGKTPQQSMTAIARLQDLQSLGCPLLVGASRKRFIATVVPSEPHERLGGSLAAHLLAIRNGARIIRTHDVAATVQAIRVTAAIEDFR